MGKVQVVYVLLSTTEDLYLQEFWVSVYSLRIYDKDRDVRVICDRETASYIRQFSTLEDLITEIIIVDLPEKYSTGKLKSRQIKTTIREYVHGPYLFVDTDTTICSSIDEIDAFLGSNAICAVVDTHLPIKEMMFTPRKRIMDIFGVDMMNGESYFNSGVMFVPDNDMAHSFYKRWNENWNYSAFVKGQSLDQPALYKTDLEFGCIINKLPDVFNVQVALSMKFFPEAVIVHWWHLPFIKNQEYNKFLSREIYGIVKENNAITDEVAEIIRNVKISFDSPSTIIGKEQIYFLFSPAGKIFNKIYKEGGAASFLMIKMAIWLDKLHKLTRRNK